MEELERLKIEVLEMNNPSISAIFDYLKSRTDLYEKFNNKEKSIQQMYNFIYEKAKTQRHGNVAMISDNVVYLWAVTYFNKSNEELGLNTKKVMPPTANEVIQKMDPEKVQPTDNNQITLFEEVQN